MSSQVLQNVRAYQKANRVILSLFLAMTKIVVYIRLFKRHL